MDRETGDSESQLSSDRKTIEGWVGEHDVVPVRHAGTEGEPSRLRIVSTDRQTDEHEEVTWDEFHEEIDREDQVVVYHGVDREEPFEVFDRSDAVQRTAVEDEAVEEALLEGEIVTTEITETTVVERKIVEEASIESEVIDREVVEVDVVDAELLTREVVDCEVTDLGPTRTDGEFDVSQFESGYRSDDHIEVAAEIDEAWTVTKEIVERVTIESRVIDTDVTETDTVEDATVESSVDVEGVQRTILDSDLIDADAATTEILESGSIESESGEGDVVHTQLIERKTVEEEVSLEKRYAGDITGGETTAASTINREVVESEIVDREEIEFEIETIVDTETEVKTDIEGQGESEAEVESTSAEAGTTEETTIAQETATAGGDVDVADSTVTPTEDDEGKTVVDASGKKIGLVANVEGGTVYVDPHPSITDRIKAELELGDMDDDDAYPITSDQIVRITDDEVELTIEDVPDESE